MQKSAHCFSYYSLEPETYLIKRPWWAFWRHDELSVADVWKRHTITNFEFDEIQYLVEAFDGTRELEMRLITKLLLNRSKAITCMSLEKNSRPLTEEEWDSICTLIEETK
jgi:hypothetical protein